MVRPGAGSARRRLADVAGRPAAVDRARARLELRGLRTPAQDRDARCARRPDARDPGAVARGDRGLLVSAGERSGAFPDTRHVDQPVAPRRRTGHGRPAAAVRSRRAAPLADDARAASVPEPDLAVPARRLAFPGTVLAVAAARLRAHLGCAGALQHRRLAQQPPGPATGSDADGLKVIGRLSR